LPDTQQPVLVADPWTQWDHIATDDDDDALGDDDHGDDDRPLSGTASVVTFAPSPSLAVWTSDS